MIHIDNKLIQVMLAKNLFFKGFLVVPFPRSGVSVIVHNGEKVLLIKRGKEPFKDHWSLPGGTQELGETLEECAIREIKEETSLDIKNLTFAAVRDRISRTEDGAIAYHYILTTFMTNTFSGTPIAMDDAKDIGWFSLEEMSDLLTTPQTPQFIEEQLAKLK